MYILRDFNQYDVNPLGSGLKFQMLIRRQISLLFNYPVVHYILLELAQQTKLKFVFCTGQKRRERLPTSPFYFGPSFASMYI
jgi:hypothetical protein